MEVYSGSLFVPVNPPDPLQNPASTTEGSVWGPRQTLTGGAVMSIGKVTVCHTGTEREQNKAKAPLNTLKHRVESTLLSASVLMLRHHQLKGCGHGPHFSATTGSGTT
ncbi:hypothetical protein NQZ68_008281 [Dissostichus eleginoides]|nr:hypothetical protein NQZ68_008281 [Dissostichus eleginoides]